MFDSMSPPMRPICHTPEDRVRLPEFALYKSKYEGNEYTTAPTQQ